MSWNKLLKKQGIRCVCIKKDIDDDDQWKIDKKVNNEKDF